MRWLALDRPVRSADVAWIGGGAMLALTGAVAAARHDKMGVVPVYATVAVVLILMALAVWRGVGWVVAVLLVGQAGQIASVAGTAWELASGVAAVKANEVRGIGFDPATAVAINLCYSAVGFALFCWHVIRLRRRR